jgi:hypothetical protein
MNVSTALILMTAALFAGSCLNVQAATNHVRAGSKSRADEAALQGKWHSFHRKVPSSLPKIETCEKMNPVWWLKNADDPVPPDWYRPGEKGRALKWSLRNPFHNFTHYVIGVADKPFVRSGRYPRDISNPHGGWNFAVTKYKWVRLPFISYRRGRFEFYLGWRVRGNFGIKINFKPVKKS